MTKAERARRTAVYEEALASVRLEGFDLDEQAKALYRRYIDGELTLAEVGSAIDELDDREFGPVSLPRHKRPKEPARSH
ncbi:MAG: antitoxin VbhA family protein [Bryobacteraceae bacterium]